MLEAMCGLGWCSSSVSLPSLLLVDRSLLPQLSTVFTQVFVPATCNIFEVVCMNISNFLTPASRLRGISGAAFGAKLPQQVVR